MTNVDQIFDILKRSDTAGYFGEPVSQLQHALQAAQSARDSGADDEMVIASLLHDIGHLIEEPESGHGIGSVDHDDVGAAYLRDRGFSERVVALVGGHVAAKRYLTATNPRYLAGLSLASTKTLDLQGGPFTPEQASAFRTDPLFQEKLRLRSWDEQAKRTGVTVAPLASYRELVQRHLERLV